MGGNTGNGGRPGGDSEDGISGQFARDELYRALAATPRRRIVYCLLEEHRRSVEELVTALTGWEATDQSTTGTREDQQKLSLALIHQHLPVLAAADILRYDREREQVELASLDPRVADLVRWSVAEGGSRGDGDGDGPR
jgi:hypothetical protein